ncbi:hypothetical protein DFA_03625 [Cavenderia fasciculata]|uniref:RRM domain-containing protein n=1 Tax=Cavenderia fasciculata TaxID=261658 RepID=F4PIE7_CACFS|nr:uncharacterized protein DFA_03625 [Cavenderia fasciculata]EGG25376.1 hypothetical protein DFA_03625 [Cavenderia fasciculata]|eukprot:XP_004363227.1 hypothetical protein DFA_03625 [Cavenderia fasciculata]
MNWADETENEELERERLREIERENAPAQQATEPSVDDQQTAPAQQQDGDQRRSSERDERDNNSNNNYRSGGYEKNYNRQDGGYNRGGYNNNRYNNNDNRRQDGGGYNNNRYNNNDNRSGGNYDNRRQDGGGYNNNRYNNNDNRRQDGGGYNNNNNNNNRYPRRDNFDNQPKYVVILTGFETEPTKDQIFDFISNSEKVGQIEVSNMEFTQTSVSIALKNVESYQALLEIDGEIFEGKTISAKGQSTNRFAEYKPPRYNNNNQQQQSSHPQHAPFGQPPSHERKSNPFGNATPVDTDKINRDKEDKPQTSQPSQPQQPQVEEQKTTEPYRPKQQGQQGGFRKSNDTFNNNRGGDVQRNDKPFNNNRKDFGANKNNTPSKGGFDNMKPKKPQMDQDGWTTTSGKKEAGTPGKIAQAPVPKKDTPNNKFASLMEEDD